MTTTETTTKAPGDAAGADRAAKLAEAAAWVERLAARLEGDVAEELAEAESDLDMMGDGVARRVVRIGMRGEAAVFDAGGLAKLAAVAPDLFGDPARWFAAEVEEARDHASDDWPGQVFLLVKRRQAEMFVADLRRGAEGLREAATGS